MYGLDLFSGIGGITKALEPWVRPVAYCENDRYCQAVLLSRMARCDIPNAPIWDDVRTFTSDMAPRNIGIIYGGFPCQDISLAGRGAGLDGKRSGLFFEIVRLVGEIRPRFIFLENVPAIRSRGGAEVVGTLAGLGYNCRWDVLSAYDVGAPHIRERWFLLAHDMREQTKRDDARGFQYKPAGSGKDVADSDGVRKLQPEGCQQKQRGRAGDSGETLSDAVGNGRRKVRMGESTIASKRELRWPVEPDVGRVAHGIPFRVDRLRGLGNSVVPAQAREAFRRLMGFPS